jgi:hypothetical protein
VCAGRWVLPNQAIISGACRERSRGHLHRNGPGALEVAQGSDAALFRYRRRVLPDSQFVRLAERQPAPPFDTKAGSAAPFGSARANAGDRARGRGRRRNRSRAAPARG